MFLPEFKEGGLLSRRGGIHLFLKRCDSQSDCGLLEVCYAQSYCAAFCREGAASCQDGYQCHLGLCLIEHPELISKKGQVFPCLGDLECPLDMVCNQVSFHFINICTNAHQRKSFNVTLNVKWTMTVEEKTCVKKENAQKLK